MSDQEIKYFVVHPSIYKVGEIISMDIRDSHKVVRIGREYIYIVRIKDRE